MEGNGLRCKRGAKTILPKLPGNFEMAAQAHPFAKHHYVLEGEYEFQGKGFPAGSYRVISKGTDHT